jgi:hypothetical protein
VLADPSAGAPWRADLGLAEPSPDLSRAVDSLQRRVRTALIATEATTLTNVLVAAHDSIPSTHQLDRLARRLLRSALEQRELREARTGGELRPQGQLREAS